MMPMSSTAGEAAPHSRFSINVRVLAVAILAVIAGFIWASDSITLQGERTVYTAECQRGAWQGQRCNGTLLAGARYRFRALPSRREVDLWVSGVSQPLAKFTDCEVVDGRNWTCRPGSDASRTIALEMVRGHPVQSANGLTMPLHAVPKWRWYLLRCAIPLGNDIGA